MKENKAINGTSYLTYNGSHYDVLIPNIEKGEYVDCITARTYSKIMVVNSLNSGSAENSDLILNEDR